MTTVEVFADVGCPFTHVGLLRFVEVRAERGIDDVFLRVRAWPLETVNGAPMDPVFIAEEVEEIRAQLDDDCFSGFDQDCFPATSVPAMALAEAAYEVGDRVGEAVSLQLRDLLFGQGADITSPEVLAGVARQWSVDFDPSDQDHNAEVVRAAHAEGVERGVVGSPHFFTPDGDFFCPALDVGRDSQGQLQVRADPAGFDAFISACLD